MHWSCKYLSIPYHEMNCAEFVEHILDKEFSRKFKFPQNHGSVFSQSHEIKQELQNYVRPEPTLEPKDGDLVLMNAQRKMCHVGILVKRRGALHVLHTQKNIGSACLHRLKDLPYYGLSLQGIYKWLR